MIDADRVCGTLSGRWSFLAAVFGCLWVVVFVGCHQWMTADKIPPTSYFQAVAGEAVWAAAFGYLIAAAALAAWLAAPARLRYGQLLGAMICTTGILAAHEYLTATLLSDEKTMAVAIAARNQFARVWYCGMLVFIVMRLTSLTMGCRLEAADSTVLPRRPGISHLMGLTTLVALFFLSAKLLRNAENGTSLKDFSSGPTAWLWLTGVAVLLILAIANHVLQKRRSDRPSTSAGECLASGPGNGSVRRTVTLLAAIALVLGSSHWFNTFSDHFMSWFQIDWSMPNPIRVRGHMWSIVPTCGTAALVIAIPLTCGLVAGRSLLGKLAFCFSLAIAPAVYLISSEVPLNDASVFYYPIAVAMGTLLAAIPTLIVAASLRRAGYRPRLV